MPPYPPAAMLKNAAILEQAARFEDRQWLQGCYAHNAAGEKVDYLDPTAVQLCAAGHLLKASHAAGQRNGGGRLYAAINREMLPGGPDLTAWNDQPGRRPEQVRRLFQKAAQRLRQQAAAATAAAETQAAATEEPATAGL